MKELKFVCPKCGKNELGSVEQVVLTYPITRIPDDGDLNYDYDNPTSGDGQVIAYQCINCGFELKDEDENPIHDCLQVPKCVLVQRELDKSLLQLRDNLAFGKEVF